MIIIPKKDRSLTLNLNSKNKSKHIKISQLLS